MTTQERAAAVACFDELQARLDAARTLTPATRRAEEATAVIRFCVSRLNAARTGREWLPADLTIAYDRLHARATKARLDYNEQSVREARATLPWRYNA